MSLSNQDINEDEQFQDALMSLPSSEDPKDEDDTCPICLEDMPLATWRGTERCRLLCCGKQVCQSCFQVINERKLECIQQWRRRLEQSSRNAAVQQVQVMIKDLEQQNRCPMCRANLPVTDRDRFQLVQKSASMNQPWAQHKLGMYYKYGVGVDKNPKVAFEWFRKAADSGYGLHAYHELGMCYAFGNGTAKNLVKACECYEKVVSENALTQFQLAQILIGKAGPGVPLDLPRAFTLLQQASEEGVKEAQCDLAYCYENGEGTSPSLERSIFWNRKAAMQGNVVSQANLAGNLIHMAAKNGGGNILPAGSEALYWARKSLAGGYIDAKSLVDQLEAAFLNKCVACQKMPTPANPLKICSKCRAMAYCCVEHQKDHWRSGHKKECFDVKEADREYAEQNKSK